ncbi:hypothetical protein HDU97_000246 [Phlyctochytrium planicorne]|nr:hypothetical protein HDU97_000246 [Phlyctochytrium planicorne]
MPPIEDLTIEPNEGKTSFLHGYLGVTPTVVVSGNVKFKASKSLSIAHIKIVLVGDVFISISGTGDWRPLVSSSPTNIFITPKTTRKVVLQQQKILLAPANSDAKKKADRYVPLSSGVQTFPFEFNLLESVTAQLPASMETEWDNGGDALKVQYRLQAIVGLAPGLFSSTVKTDSTVEYVDFPKIDVPTVLRAAGTDTGLVIAGSNDKVDYKVSIDRSIAGLKEPIKFTIHHIRPTNHKTIISGVSLAIRQDTTLTVEEGKTRVIRDLICVPEVSGKVLVKDGPGAGKATGTPTWSGEVTGSVDSTHLKNKKKAIDAFQTTTAELFSVRHAFEVSIKIKGEPDFRVEAPCHFIDADAETRAWVLRNAAAIREENEE